MGKRTPGSVKKVVNLLKLHASTSRASSLRNVSLELARDLSQYINMLETTSIKRITIPEQVLLSQKEYGTALMNINSVRKWLRMGSSL